MLYDHSSLQITFLNAYYVKEDNILIFKHSMLRINLMEYVYKTTIMNLETRLLRNENGDIIEV